MEIYTLLGDINGEYIKVDNWRYYFNTNTKYYGYGYALIYSDTHDGNKLLRFLPIDNYETV